MATDGKEAKHDARAEVTVSEGPDRRRQGKFQPFRRLFGKKKRRQTVQEFEEAELKPSHSTGDVCNGVVSGHEETNKHLREINPLGSRAFSHESVFIREDSVENQSSEQTMSQENVSDKVRNLQRQIAHNIKFGQKLPSVRKSEGDEGSSDEEEVPRSPLRVLAQVETEPQEAKARDKVSTIPQDVAQHRTPVKSPRTKRLPPPGTIESINLDAVPQSGPRLDNTAAKHKLSVKPKNQRVSRKHRRFTQELDVDFSALQEEAVVQKLAEESEVWREEYARSHRTGDDHETPKISKKQRLQEEEQERLELERIREQEEQRRRDEERSAEELRLEEERRRRVQEEERLRRDEEERRREEEEKRRREEERRLKEEEERKRHEEEERKRREEEERKRAEEERRQQELEAEHLRLEEERKKNEERRKKEQAEEQRLRELEEKRHAEAEKERIREETRRRQEEEEAEKKRLAEEKKMKEEEADRKRQQQEERTGEEWSRASDPEWKRKAEELRWREMEERQRPFTFKVSSGEKQILFEKVNLSPVTPLPGQQSDAAAETQEGSAGSADSPTLSSSLYVPHTAILVTGAQLCGTAVNFDQIKDSACKSLLGMSEDKKGVETPPLKGKTSPDRKSGKTKSLTESSLSADQASAAVLAEWASIRSKIFKGAEDGKYQGYPDQTRKQAAQNQSEDTNQLPFTHANLRKTVSASAKFSITPARKKFADSNRNSEILNQEDREGDKMQTSPTDSAPCQSGHSPFSANKSQMKGGKTVRISDSAEECKFAKDLPSFLVPSPPHGSPKSQRSETGSFSQLKSEDFETKDDGDQRDQSSDERPSPFGIKLRRTNYSLRFHSEQSTEKRKKRYSAGDSFDGVPVPLTSIDQDSDSFAVSEKCSPVSPLRESAGVKLQAISSAEPWSKTGRNTLPLVTNEHDKFVSKPLLYQKPATSPKPCEGATPPPSPLPKPSRRISEDTPCLRAGGPESAAAEESSDHKEEHSEYAPAQKNNQGDDEPKEKKSFFPSISIPWREKTDRRLELIKREKPSLQSRHSLDSSRAQEKEAGPLWITLALQKQKGFREQQQSREDRKTQREAKLAEKQAKEKESVGQVSPTEGKGNGNSTPPKPQTPEENKRPDTLLARFERRDNLKKANTLPSSVTVEIADSTPSPPAAKEIKRFPPGDAPQVSTEPAWLALAKRKAKAWSDCPQIIK